MCTAHLNVSAFDKKQFLDGARCILTQALDRVVGVRQNGGVLEQLLLANSMLPVHACMVRLAHFSKSMLCLCVCVATNTACTGWFPGVCAVLPQLKAEAGLQVFLHNQVGPGEPSPCEVCCCSP